LEKKQKLLLIDGNGLAYRAFYALPPLKTSLGEPVSAVYGFATMLLKILEQEHPDFLAASFDKGPPTIRKEAFPEYKAQREKMPEDLSGQFVLIEEFLDILGVPVFWEEGYEADDCLATLARRAEENGLEVLILSGDRDLLQLVSPDIRVLIPRKGISDLATYDEAAVRERFGLSPEQLVDMKALSGDPSDNIPGVPGIGEKTASKLISEYGSLENLLARSEEVPGKAGALLREHRESALLGRKLVTLEANLPLPIRWEDLKLTKPDSERLRELLGRLEFKALLEKIIPEERPIQAGLIPPPCEIVSEESLPALSRRLTEEKSFSILWLATSPDIGGRLLGIALGLKDEGCFYLPLACAGEMDLFHYKDNSSISIQLALKCLEPALKDERILKVCTRLKSGHLLWERENFSLGKNFFDISLASYLLEPDETNHQIWNAASRLLSASIPTEEDLLGKGVKARTYAQVEPEELQAWCSLQCAALLALSAPLSALLKDNGLERLFGEVETPLSAVLARMEAHGMALETGRLARLSRDLDEHLDRLRSEITTLAGEEFNINSPAQVSRILFEKLRIIEDLKVPAGEKKSYSTASEILENLAHLHPIIDKILDYREVCKLKSGYVESLPRLINPESGRIHTTFNQMVAATGRLSSSRPNLQNIPVRTSWGREIRQAFIPCKAGDLFLCGDYSQVELRILAHLSKDEKLLEAFERGEDIHRLTASEIFGVTLEEVTGEMRRTAKVVNFGIIYGMSAHGLSQTLKIPRNEAGRYINIYLERFQGVHKFIENTVAGAAETGFVSTLLGRRRRVDGIRSRNATVRKNAERIAVNAPVQGSAADLIKVAMIRMQDEIEKRGLAGRMVLQVHDELVFEVPPEEVEIFSELARETMEKAYDLCPPLRITLKSGKNWGELEALPDA